MILPMDNGSASLFTAPNFSNRALASQGANDEADYADYREYERRNIGAGATGDAAEIQGDDTQEQKQGPYCEQYLAMGWPITKRLFPALE
jgi:hypothetical protein